MKFERIAVLTSGGDAPGMNAAIRAVVRTGIDAGMEVIGVRRGFAGLIAGEFVPLQARDVGGIMHQGGTMLRTARSPEFDTDEGQRAALEQLSRQKIEALVVIGGSGSQNGACALWRHGFPVMGLASTIDNDVYGSEMAIGVDTALNIALEAIDRLKTTASSLQRAFLVEVMGRRCGYLALMAGIAGGAEVISIPEAECDPEAMAQEFVAAYARGKAHAIGVIAEGTEYNADRVAHYFHEHRARIGFELRVTTLGHVQRGGAPTAFDRLLATRFGVATIEHLARGESGAMVGLLKGDVATTPLDVVVSTKKSLDIKLVALAKVLAK